MHAEAMSPETLAQDNAFPVFPTYQNRSRPGTANGTHEESGRGSTDAHSEERPVMSRDKSYGSEPSQRPQEAISRPTLEHKPVSFNAIHDQPQVQHVSPPPQQHPQQQKQSQLQRHDSNMAPIPVDQRMPRDQQVQAHRRPIPNARDPTMQQQAPPSAGYNNAAFGQPTGLAEDVGRQPRQQQPRGPTIEPIDTQHLPQHQGLSYMDHGPLSPAVVPPRAASAHGSRRVAQPLTSPTSAYSQATPQDQFGQAYGAPSGNAPASYVDNRVPPPPIAAPMTREQEIENEMPDFDSAAPGGTSLLHKRNQVPKPPEKPATPLAELPSPTPLPHQLGQGEAPAPVHGQRFYGQNPPPSSASLNQHPPQPKHGGITDGFVFEVPGDTPTQQHFDSSYMDDIAQPQHAPQRYAQPPQQPYAREPPRRSMDDARQMPYRNGPPNPRGPPQQGRAPPRGPPPLQQRPPMDRNFSAQTAYTDPMPDRGGSAPPRQAMQAPPARPPMGAPLTQQRSAPDQHDPSLRHSNPDSLPHHPVPVRQGLVDNGSGLYAASKPQPVRNYNNGQPAQHQRQGSMDRSSKPVTPAELQKLRAYVDANPQNHKQGLVLAKKLVEAGSVLASEGGRADARTTAKNRERYIMDAYKLVKKLVSAGYPDAQFYLADCYGSGELGTEVDPREAFKLYQAAAKAGHGEAAYRTAMCCEMGAEDGGGTNKDFAKAVQWYRRAAALGNSEGMFKVGVISLKGLLGQPRNLGEAVSWLKRSLQSGQHDNPHAMYELGILHESINTNPEVRNKVVADDAYALELFQKAAGIGHKFSQFRLGQAYEYGQLGLQIDNRASISWYSKAAAQGEHQAELALSGWYLTGAEGILEHSDMEAYLWARKAASSEPPLAKAMFAMGYFTETGIGCPASLDEAKKWYGRAACKCRIPVHKSSSVS